MSDKVSPTPPEWLGTETWTACPKSGPLHAWHAFLKAAKFASSEEQVWEHIREAAERGQTSVSLRLLSDDFFNTKDDLCNRLDKSLRERGYHVDLLDLRECDGFRYEERGRFKGAHCWPILCMTVSWGKPIVHFNGKGVQP